MPEKPLQINNKREKVAFTGGGSGGHVFPNMPLIDYYKEKHEVLYFGTRTGVERDLVSDWGVSYVAITAGKLRRYFDIQNIVDLFKALFGVLETFCKLIYYRPKFIFSKGGFVSVPVCISGWLLRIPVYIHEADSTPGLSNRIASRFATKVFLTFPPKTKPLFPYVVSGLPMRSELYTRDKQRGLDFLKITSQKPILLILGGSLGSANINTVVRKNIDELLKTFTVVHSTGKGKRDDSLQKEGYIQKEFIGGEIFDCIEAVDIVVSRAGAGGMMELLTIQKPTLFIPLGLDQSRGDQIENCEYIQSTNTGLVLYEQDMTSENFLEKVTTLYSKRNEYKESIKNLHLPNAVEIIIQEIGR